MLYHVSSTSGLKKLSPRVSTHGKAYVYAIENLVTGLLFGAKQDDFDFMISEDESGNPVLYECYPDALKTVYKGKECSVYEVEEDGFLRGVTGWEPELVCEKEVGVTREEKVTDLYTRLLEEEAARALTIFRYEDSSEYKHRISEHIVDRLIRFDMMQKALTDQKLQKYFGRLIAELNSIMDGHLL